MLITGVDEKGVINDTPLEQLTFTSAIKSLNDISLNQFDTRAYVVNKNDKNFSSYKGAIYNKKGDTLMYLAHLCEAGGGKAFLREYFDECIYE